jgi:hypothetical protein
MRDGLVAHAQRLRNRQMASDSACSERMRCVSYSAYDTAGKADDHGFSRRSALQAAHAGPRRGGRALRDRLDAVREMPVS